MCPDSGWRNLTATLSFAACRCNYSRCLCTPVSACPGALGHCSAVSCSAVTAECAGRWQCGQTAASTCVATFTAAAAACTRRHCPAALIRSRHGIRSCAAAAACRASNATAVASSHGGSCAATAATSRHRLAGIRHRRAPCSASAAGVGSQSRDNHRSAQRPALAACQLQQAGGTEAQHRGPQDCNEACAGAPAQHVKQRKRHALHMSQLLLSASSLRCNMSFYFQSRKIMLQHRRFPSKHEGVLLSL